MIAHTLDRDGVGIHYEVHGEPTGRTPILLSHGYSSSTRMWRPNVAALTGDRQVVTWDMRGHGASASPEDSSLYSEEATVEDMRAILDAQGVEKAVVGGLSLGGYMSLAFHATYPERVCALLLFDTGPGYRQDASRDRWNEQAERRAQAFEKRGLESLGSSPEVQGTTQNPTGLALAARGMLAQRDARVIDSLRSVAVPALVLVGENDAPYQAGTNYMADKIPGAVKVVIAAAGHSSNIDQPEVFNKSVLEFLEKVP